MALEVLDLLAGMFYNMFGSGLLLALVLSAVVVMTVLVLRGNLAVALVLLVPLFIGFVINVSSFIEFPTWILKTSFIMVGLLFGGYFMYNFLK